MGLSYAPISILVFDTLSMWAALFSQHINSADPKALPTIDPHYLEEDIDVDILVEAFKFARKVAHTGPFKELTVAEVIPGPNVTEDDQIRGKLNLVIFPDELLILPIIRTYQEVFGNHLASVIVSRCGIYRALYSL